MRQGYNLYTVTAAMAVLLSAAALSACQRPSAPSGGEAPAGPGPLDAGPFFCGGIAGFQCPPGYVCADDPTDDCDPREGGADCIGICQAPAAGCLSHGNRDYLSFDPPECAAILFLCAPGHAPFFDECGCGCVPDPGPEPPTSEPPTSTRGEPCGRSFCERGEYCCNRSCGICAPEGGSCIQVECDSPDP